MFNFMLDATDTFDFFVPERMLAALGVVLQGVLTVFAVLCIVWLALSVIRLFMYDLPRMRAKKEQNEVAEAPVAAAPAPVQATDDTLLVAIITAAIAAARENEGDGEIGFRVVSFNRKKK